MGGCASIPMNKAEKDQVPAPEPVKEEPLKATEEVEVAEEADKEGDEKQQSLGSLLDENEEEEKEKVAIEKKEEETTPTSEEAKTETEKETAAEVQPHEANKTEEK